MALCVAAAAAAVLVVVLVVLVTVQPPELLDPAAVAGEPQALPEEYGYSQMAPIQVPGSVRLCGAPPVAGKDIFLYLTNPASNIHQLRAEIYKGELAVDPKTGERSVIPGKLLGVTGFLEPGTWVEKVTLKKGLQIGESTVCIKIALRNRETGHSEGFFFLTTVLSQKRTVI